MQSNEDIHLSVEILEKEESFKRLERCLELLTLQQKQAVQLFYLEKKCYKEIAETTGIEWNMVRSYIQNGRRNLKNCMEKRTAGEVGRQTRDIKSS
jgi:RNA polymerase sigma-70 factor (ECF subfamily)